MNLQFKGSGVAIAQVLSIFDIIVLKLVLESSTEIAIERWMKANFKK